MGGNFKKLDVAPVSSSVPGVLPTLISKLSLLRTLVLPYASYASICVSDASLHLATRGRKKVFALVCLKSRGPPGGPRRPREGPRIAQGAFRGPPDKVFSVTLA